MNSMKAIEFEENEIRECLNTLNKMGKLLSIGIGCEFGEIRNGNTQNNTYTKIEQTLLERNTLKDAIKIMETMLATVRAQ